MPHAVAITRAPSLGASGGYRAAPADAARSLDAALPTLAALLGVTRLDLRMRLAGESPWVVARVNGADEAARTVASLRAEGFGAVDCDVAEARAWAPAGDAVLTLDDAGVEVWPSGRRVAYGALRALFVATLVVEHQREEVERVVVSHSGRGGPRVAKVSHSTYERTQQRAVYLAPDEGPAVRLVQAGLRCAGVRGATSRERFDAVVSELRARAPEARYDERLTASPRRRSSYASLMDEGERRGAVTSNAAETDLAVCLLTRALAERQQV
jgi:hypothetical protein